jgi:nucleoside-diphosphate-sugar epimerase
MSESVLSDYFETIVIRPGAIYGNDRNIGKRILAGKPIPSGEQPVHRIHVHDLARIIDQAIAAPGFPRLLNAVDQKCETSKQVARWLLQQPFFPLSNDSEIDDRTGFQSRKFNLSEPARTISNQKLVAEVGFKFVYPTYKEGLAHAFADKQTGKNQDPK